MSFYTHAAKEPNDEEPYSDSSSDEDLPPGPKPTLYAGKAQFVVGTKLTQEGAYYFVYIREGMLGVIGKYSFKRLNGRIEYTNPYGFTWNGGAEDKWYKRYYDTFFSVQDAHRLARKKAISLDGDEGGCARDKDIPEEI